MAEIGVFNGTIRATGCTTTTVTTVTTTTTIIKAKNVKVKLSGNVERY